MHIEILNWAKYNPKDTGHWWRMEAGWALDPAISTLMPMGKLVYVALLTMACQCSSGSYDLDMGLLCSLYGFDMATLCATLKHLKDRGKIKIPSLRGRYTRTNERTNEQTYERKETPEAQDLPFMVKEIHLPKAEREGWGMVAAVWFQKAVLLHNPAALTSPDDLLGWADDFDGMRADFDEGCLTELPAKDAITEVLHRLFEPDHPAFVVDPFWRINVQTPRDLRKHWNRITAQISNPKPKAQGYAL